LHWTLAEIAEKYDISRQRVFQILGKTGTYSAAQDKFLTKKK
jgi:predicted DNA-binding protein YlxM (UPF0122 family)